MYAMPQEQPLKSLVIGPGNAMVMYPFIHLIVPTRNSLLSQPVLELLLNSNTRIGITVVYIVKDHHCCPVTDYNLKIAPTKVNQRSFSDLLKHMSDITWT